jgi:RNA polymerase sigma factor (sigma-70 family)
VARLHAGCVDSGGRHPNGGGRDLSRHRCRRCGRWDAVRRHSLNCGRCRWSGKCALFSSRSSFLLKARAEEILEEDSGRLVNNLRKSFDLSEADAWGLLDDVEELPERERTIIALRVGEPMTLERIGRGLGLTGEKVKQIESKAFERLRVAAEERKSRSGASKKTII